MFIYYQDKDIKVALEENKDQIFIHVHMNTASKAIVKKVKQKWGEVVIRMYNDGYEDLFTYTKDNRIINLIGGAELIGETNGYEVYKWDLS